MGMPEPAPAPDGPKKPLIFQDSDLGTHKASQGSLPMRDSCLCIHFYMEQLSVCLLSFCPYMGQLFVDQLSISSVNMGQLSVCLSIGGKLSFCP